MLACREKLLMVRSTGLLAILALLCASPAHAGIVIVFETGGPGGGAIAKAMAASLQKRLAAHEVARQPRPRSWKAPSVKRTRAVAQAVRAIGADVGLDSMVTGKRHKRRLVILVVSADGEVVFDKTVRLPRRKPEKKAAGLARNIASAISDQLDSADVAEAEPVDAPAPDPTGGDDSFESSETDLNAATPMTPTPPASSETSPLPPAHELAAPEVEPEGPGRRDESEPFHFALRIGAGALSYSDTIATNVEGGELQINLGFTVVATAGVEMQVMDLVRVDIVARRHAARMTHEDPTNPSVNDVAPEVIDISAIGGTGLVGAVLDVGPLGLGVMAGASYDKLDAPAQTLVDATGTPQPVALVPAWTRMLALIGMTVNYGDLATHGLAGQLGLIAAPWGSHSEEPVTSGERSRLFGGLGWLRLRYQLTDLFGDAGGLFAELAGDVEYLRIQYEGFGTRTALGGDSPVQASKETRLTFSGGMSLGYVF